MVIIYAIAGVIGTLLVLSTLALIFTSIKMSSRASQEEQNDNK